MSIRIGVLTLIVGTMLMGGCGGRQFINISEDMLDAPHPTTARIYAKRESIFAGDGSPLYVLDSGEGIDKKYLLVEKFPSNRSRPTGRKNNVALIEGDKGLVFGKLKYVNNYEKLYGEDWREQALRRRVGDNEIGAHYAAYLGKVTFGGTLVWDRDPGNLQIQIINTLGYQVYTKLTPVEAGKDYYVHFVLGGSRVTIGETPFE